MSLTAVIDHPFASALAWSLVHFLWQGALLALAAFIFMRRLNPPASTRYLVGVATLAAMLAAPIATFAILAFVDPGPGSLVIGESVALSPGSAAAAVSTATPGTDTPAANVRPSGELIVLVGWLAGVTVLSLRLFGGWVVARRLVTRAVGPVAPEIHALARVVAGRLALDRIVHVAQSSAVRVPVMVGWLKPVVLLPAAAMSGLTIQQIEALLAHELAHVRRHDYLVNLLQSIVETLLFYHPAVWWMSRQVRADREHCCDDLAIGVCDRLVYVSALTDLAGMSARPALALAATDGSLIRRVRRILGGGREEHEKAPGWSPILLVIIGLAIIPIILASGRLPVTAANLEAQGLEAQGGVAGGVPGGVAGGVPGGVPGGVVGGVAGGVPGAVTGGVPGGVPGGVVGGLAAGEMQSVQDLQGREQAAAAQLRELEQALDRLKDERLALALRQSEMEGKARIASLEAELNAMRDQHARAKGLFEKGLANDTTVAEVAARISMLEQALAAARNEQQFRAAEIDLERRERQRMREYERHQADYEKLRLELAERMARQQFALEQKLVSDQELKAQLEYRLTDKQRNELTEVHRQYEKLLAEAQLKTPMELLMPGDRRFSELQLIESSIEITAPNETVRPGDILSIEISDEPDLPRAYIVQADGTVKLPLIGSVRVQSLTTAKVRDEIARRLDDLRVKGRSVEVRLRRPR